MRILLKKRQCPICINYLGVVQRINARLPIDKRIQVVDTSDYEEHGINLSPIINHLQWSGTPTLFINGIKVVGATTKEHIRGFLESFLKEEFLY